MNREAKRIFSPGALVSFRGARKISSYLLKLNYIFQRDLQVQGNVKYADAQIVLMSQKKIPFLVLLQVKLSRQIMNLIVAIDDKCLIYFLKCRICKKQYRGETTDAYFG